MSKPLPSNPGLNATMFLNFPDFLWSSLQTTMPLVLWRTGHQMDEVASFTGKMTWGKWWGLCNPALCPGDSCQAAGEKHGPRKIGVQNNYCCQKTKEQTLPKPHRCVLLAKFVEILVLSSGLLQISRAWRGRPQRFQWSLSPLLHHSKGSKVAILLQIDTP